MDNTAGLKANLIMDAVSAQAACMRLPPCCIWLQALCPKPLGALHQQAISAGTDPLDRIIGLYVPILGSWSECCTEL